MQRPFFSIIVPTYNRRQQLAACLQSLSHLDYSRHRFEVIVIDDASETPPNEVCSAFRDRLNIELLKQPHGGPAAARNTGSLRAKGEFLVFTDDDCRSQPDWLRQLELRCLAAPDHMIGGARLIRYRLIRFRE